MEMINCNAKENIATSKVSHCCARNAEGRESTTGEMKMARMSRIRQATTAMPTTLFIVPEYSILRIQANSLRCSASGLGTGALAE